MMLLSLFDLDGFDAVSPETIAALIVVLSVMAMLLAVAVVQSAIDWRARRLVIFNQGTAADASPPNGHPRSVGASARANKVRGRG